MTSFYKIHEYYLKILWMSKFQRKKCINFIFVFLTRPYVFTCFYFYSILCARMFFFYRVLLLILLSTFFSYFWIVWATTDFKQICSCNVIFILKFIKWSCVCIDNIPSVNWISHDFLYNSYNGLRKFCNIKLWYTML